MDNIVESRPYLDFYQKHDVSPVVNETDFDKYFYQREMLYQTLNINKLIVEGRNILEFGPGNGINSIYTMSLKPKSYYLVDGNPTGIKNLKHNFLRFYPSFCNYHIVDSLIEVYASNQKYDLVICEGLPPNQKDPPKFSSLVASHVKSGGLYLITCHDVISNFSEILRSFIAHLLSKHITSFKNKVDFLVYFLRDDLSCLKNMSRTRQDWVIDNVLNTEFWKDSQLFSIEEAVITHQNDFIYYSSSPRFYQDWRWYKDMSENTIAYNNRVVDQYTTCKHNLIDWRLNHGPRSVEENRKLSDICSAVKGSIRTYMGCPSDDRFEVVESALFNAEKVVGLLSEDLRLAIRAYRETLRYAYNGDTKKADGYTHFQNWWGRGMQYISFIKR